jgi:hypothetical protein
MQRRRGDSQKRRVVDAAVGKARPKAKDLRTMTKNDQKADAFDPMGMFKAARDSGLESWSKAMAGLLHGEAFAEANGAMLDALLSTSAPFRKSLETVMAQTLANLSLPSRDEVARLAERLTNLEMRLDEMYAKLDRLLLISGNDQS